MTQVEAHGAAKLGQCACASPIALVHPLPDDVMNHVQILHRKDLMLARLGTGTCIQQAIKVKHHGCCAAINAGVQAMLASSITLQQGSYLYLVLLMLRSQASRHLWRSVTGAAGRRWDIALV